MVNRTERGWAGHYILADRCMFRRNTLLEKGSMKVVVSTVGRCREHSPDANKVGAFQTVGHNRYFETAAFYADSSDSRWHDADVTRPFEFNSPSTIAELDADDKANDMHEAVVAEITAMLEAARE